MATTTDPAIDALTFDDALAELQRTVAELEAGGQPLEAAIALYERGVALQARCERLLGDAELRVQQLVARAGGALETRDVRPEDATEDPAARAQSRGGPDERRGDVQVEPEPVVRVVARLDRRQAGEALGAEGEPDALDRSRRPGRSWRSRRRSATRPPSRSAVVARPGDLRVVVGRVVPDREGAARSRSPPAGRTRRRPRGSVRAAPRIASSRITLRPSGRAAIASTIAADDRLVERPQEMALPVVAQPERQPSAHRLDVGVLHRPDACPSIDRQGGPERPQDVVGVGRRRPASRRRRGPTSSPSGSSPCGPICAVSSSASGRGRGELGELAQDLLDGADRVGDVAGQDRPGIDRPELERR